MQDLNDLYYFVQVVDHGGFAPAGRALSIPKSKLSRRVALLEKRLGVTLILRTTRQFSVTEIGDQYYRHCRAMLIEANAAAQVIERSRSEPCGNVRLTCPVALLNVDVSPMLTSFMQRYDQVGLHLEATNRRVDVLNEGVDVAIRVRPEPLHEQELTLIRLAESRQALVYSPALKARSPVVNSIDELHRLPSLHMGTPADDARWQLSGPQEQNESISHSPRYITGDMMALRDAAVAGIGIAKLPVNMIRTELNKGLLLPVIEGWSPVVEVVHLVHAQERGMLPSISALIEHLSRGFSQWQQSDSSAR